MCPFAYVLANGIQQAKGWPLAAATAAVERIAAAAATVAKAVSAAEAQQENNDNDPTAIVVTEHVSSSFNWIHPILCPKEK